MDKVDTKYSDLEVNLYKSSQNESSSSESTSQSLTTSETSQTSELKSPESPKSEASLESLAVYLADHVKPSKKDYTEFATSYIPSIIPNTTSKIYCDETGSYTAEPPPFKTLIKNKDFVLQEKRRTELGDSLRKEKLIPASRYILKEIQKYKPTNSELTRVHLFYKARQWCEVNKALAHDAKYPKISPSIIRDKYSPEHRKASEIARKKQGFYGKGKTPPMFEPPTISPFPIPLELLFNKTELREGEIDCAVIPGVSDGMANVVQNEGSQQTELRMALKDIFGEICPVPEMQHLEEPWQFKVKDTSTIKPKPSKKPSIKRTEYPPKSKEEKISDLRKLLPPLKPDNLQTDYLSGIWEPELMTDSFSISPLNYDSRLEKDGDDSVDGIDDSQTDLNWYNMRDAKEKCKSWLQSIPD